MCFNIMAHSCHKDVTLPLIRENLHNLVETPAHILINEASALCPNDNLVIGSILNNESADAQFIVSGRIFLDIVNRGSDQISTRENNSISFQAYSCPLLTALADINCMKEAGQFRISKNGWSLAIITLSDKGFCGKREDLGGPLIEKMARSAINICISKKYLISDDTASLRALLTDLSCNQGFDLILTTGGTGLSPRDITPQTTERMLDAHIDGIVQAMMMAGLAKTPHAAISRAKAGIIGKSLVINLPGSPKAIRENLEAVLPVLEHTLSKLHGDQRDCGTVI